MACRGSPLSRSLLGVKRTCPSALQMSAYDPKRTSIEIRLCYAARHLSLLHRYSCYCVISGNTATKFMRSCRVSDRAEGRLAAERSVLP